MVTGRTCVCGRRNYSDYKDCPHKSCVKRLLMEGETTFSDYCELEEMNMEINQLVVQPDIVDRLKAYADVSEITGAYTEANCAQDAIKIINDLRAALRKIGYDYVEFSHEKVNDLYLEHIMTARKALLSSYPDYKEKMVEKISPNDDF